MSIEINHDLKPEFEGDKKPNVRIDSLGVWMSDAEGKTVHWTHDQFNEAIEVFNFFVRADAKLTEKMS